MRSYKSIQLKLVSKILLLPFSQIYVLGVWIREWLFRTNVLKRASFEVPVIVVGNLTVGGTGKTPHIEYLVRNFSQYNIASLSRGYGRRTKGFLTAGPESTARTIGDEPMQFYNKFKDLISVHVDPDRAMAIPRILSSHPKTGLLLLDDAFQHRYVNPRLSILLCDYQRPFYEDNILPAGRLREPRSFARYADIVLVTKCPEELEDSELNAVSTRVKKYSKAPVFFTKTCSGLPFDKNQEVFKWEDMGKVITISAIAHNERFINSVQAHTSVIKSFKFADHHVYTQGEWNKVRSLAHKENAKIVTTEKDYMRLKLLDDSLDNVFVVPIEVNFLSHEEDFKKLVKQAIEQ